MLWCEWMITMVLINMVTVTYLLSFSWRSKMNSSCDICAAIAVEGNIRMKGFKTNREAGKH